jgi:hypothetical protein
MMRRVGRGRLGRRPVIGAAALFVLLGLVVVVVVDRSRDDDGAMRVRPFIATYRDEEPLYGGTLVQLTLLEVRAVDDWVLDFVGGESVDYAYELQTDRPIDDPPTDAASFARCCIVRTVAPVDRVRRTFVDGVFREVQVRIDGSELTTEERTDPEAATGRLFVGFLSDAELRRRGWTVAVAGAAGVPAAALEAAARAGGVRRVLSRSIDDECPRPASHRCRSARVEGPTRHEQTVVIGTTGVVAYEEERLAGVVVRTSVLESLR